MLDRVKPELFARVLTICVIFNFLKASLSYEYILGSMGGVGMARGFGGRIAN